MLPPIAASIARREPGVVRAVQFREARQSPRRTGETSGEKVDGNFPRPGRNFQQRQAVVASFRGSACMNSRNRAFAAAAHRRRESLPSHAPFRSASRRNSASFASRRPRHPEHNISLIGSRPPPKNASSAPTTIIPAATPRRSSPCANKRSALPDSAADCRFLDRRAR